MKDLLNKCTTPGCPNRCVKGRCGACRLRMARTSPARNRYGPDWSRRRLEYLTAHPRCELCTHQATVPDHYPLSRRILVAMGIGDPDADEYLRPLCDWCHNKETARHQPGGWHRDRTRWQH